jgi:hypothetical protein
MQMNEFSLSFLSVSGETETFQISSPWLLGFIWSNSLTAMRHLSDHGAEDGLGGEGILVLKAGDFGFDRLAFRIS